MEINENVESVLIVFKNEKGGIIRHAFANAHLNANNDIIWICEKETMVHTIYNTKEILFIKFAPVKGE